MRDRQRAIALGVHLAQPAGLEARRHQEEIAAGEDRARLLGVESDAHADRLAVARGEIGERGLHARFASTHHHDLAAAVDDGPGDVDRQIEAFLADEARDEPRTAALATG